MKQGLELNLTGPQQEIYAEQGQSSYNLGDFGKSLAKGVTYLTMLGTLGTSFGCAGYSTKINNVDVQDPLANMRPANTTAPETKGWYCSNHPWICVGVGVAVIAGGAAALSGGGSSSSTPATVPSTPPAGGGSDPNGPGTGTGI